MKFFETLSKIIKYENPYWSYILEQYRLPNGKVADYHYVHTAGSVFILPQLEDGRFVMVNQYRYLNREFSIEFAGGGLKEEQNPLEQAKAELMEECGYYSEDLTKIGEFNPFKGVTNEICIVYFAKSLVQAVATPEESEYIQIVYHTEAEIDSMIASNKINDGMSLAAWAIYKNKKGEL